MAKTAACDRCDNIINEGQGFAFFSFTTSTNPSIKTMGNMLLCEECANEIANEESFNRERPQSFKASSLLDQNEYRRMFQLVNDGSIIERCKSLGLSSEQAKQKAHELAQLFWRDDRDDKEAWDAENCAFWTSDSVASKHVDHVVKSPQKKWWQFWKKKYGSSGTQDQALKKLVKELLSPNGEVRIHGLEKATKLASLGDQRGLVALEEAIRIKAGSRDIEFYQVKHGRFRHPVEIVASRAHLLKLSRYMALLKDPKVTGDLIAAFIHDKDAYKINKFADEIGVEGGEDQFHAFQLIYSQLHASTTLQSVLKKSISVSKELYHIFLVWSHPEPHDQLKLVDLILSVIPDYSERSKPDDGKVGTVWITDPIDSYDIEKAAIEFLGAEIIDSDKYEIEIKGFTDGTGDGRCLIVYKKQPIHAKVPESDVAIYVFDYNKMDSQYGHQAFKAIHRGLVLSEGSCGFSDGDLEVPARGPSGVPKLLMQFKESGCKIEPISQESPLNNLDSVSHIYGYAAAMWTDNPINIPLLHEHLKSTQAAGNLGCIVLPEKVGGHMQFFEFVRPLSLMVGINFIDGNVVPRSSKYGIR